MNGERREFVTPLTPEQTLAWEEARLPRHQAARARRGLADVPDADDHDDGLGLGD